MLFWAIIPLCYMLLCAGEDAQRDKASRDLGQVRQPRGALEHIRQMDEVGAVPMSDEPVVVVEAEQVKPKKKKTPEEIEAGKLLSWAQLEWDKHLRCSSINFFENKCFFG